ncbi:MAG: hypothetical protein LBI77_02050, partial [Puniceicoccales bacterium]|nr:hypothetical protein [Puniceicoccales bacterium]
MKQKLFSNFLLLTCITCAIAPLDLNAAAPHFTPTSPLVLKSTPADNLLKSLEALENEIGKLIRNKKDSAECVPLQEDMKMQLKYMSYVLKNIDQQSQDTIYNATGWALKYFTFILGNLEGELADPAFSILANLQQVQNTLTYISNQFQEYKAEIQKRSEDLKLMKKCKKIKNELNDLLKVFISHSIDSSKGLFCDVSQSAGVIPALYLANANNKDINGDSRLQTGLSEQIEGDLVKEMRSFISDKNLYFEDCEKEHAHFIEMLTAKKGPNHSRAYWIASGNIIENFENDLVAPAIVNFLTQCDFKDTDEL